MHVLEHRGFKEEVGVPMAYVHLETRDLLL